jgi:hypothetical protein
MVHTYNISYIWKKFNRRQEAYTIKVWWWPWFSVSESVMDLVTTRWKHLEPSVFNNVYVYLTIKMGTHCTMHIFWYITYHKSSHTWYKHRFDCERATVSTSCIWPRADTVTRRDENEGRNLSSRGFSMTCMGVTARITRRSYTIRKRSTDKLPCLNKWKMCTN